MNWLVYELATLITVPIVLAHIRRRKRQALQTQQFAASKKLIVEADPDYIEALKELNRELHAGQVDVSIPKEQGSEKGLGNLKELWVPAPSHPYSDSYMVTYKGQQIMRPSAVPPPFAIIAQRYGLCLLDYYIDTPPTGEFVFSFRVIMPNKEHRVLSFKASRYSASEQLPLLIERAFEQLVRDAQKEAQKKLEKMADQLGVPASLLQGDF